MSHFAGRPSAFRKSQAIALTCLFHGLLLMALVWQWRFDSFAPPPPPITVMPLKAVEMAPQAKPRKQAEPSAPALPPREAPAPPLPAAPELPVPLLALRPPIPLSPPAPPVTVTPHPIEPAETAPPPVQRARKGETSFESLLLARIEEMRRYPASALSRRQQGVVQLLFRMNRKGEVLSARIVGGSGFAVLDSEALKMVRRAAPLPAIPPERPDEIEVSVPIEFSLAQQERFATR